MLPALVYGVIPAQAGHNVKHQRYPQCSMGFVDHVYARVFATRSGAWPDKGARIVVYEFDYKHDNKVVQLSAGCPNCEQTHLDVFEDVIETIDFNIAIRYLCLAKIMIRTVYTQEPRVLAVKP